MCVCARALGLHGVADIITPTEGDINLFEENTPRGGVFLRPNYEQGRTRQPETKYRHFGWLSKLPRNRHDEQKGFKNGQKYNYSSTIKSGRK